MGRSGLPLKKAWTGINRSLSVQHCCHYTGTFTNVPSVTSLHGDIYKRSLSDVITQGRLSPVTRVGGVCTVIKQFWHISKSDTQHKHTTHLQLLGHRLFKAPVRLRDSQPITALNECTSVFDENSHTCEFKSLWRSMNPKVSLHSFII